MGMGKPPPPAILVARLPAGPELGPGPKSPLISPVRQPAAMTRPGCVVRADEFEGEERPRFLQAGGVKSKV